MLRHALHDAWQLSLVPALPGRLPWPRAWGLWRRLAARPGLYADAVAAAAIAAEFVPVGDAASFERNVRLTWLLDIADLHLSRRHGLLLRQVKAVLDQVPQRMSVAVVNPLHLLRELFTVNGAGTLIRRGSKIDAYPSFAGIDRARLRTLLESAFGMVMKPGVLDEGGRLERETECLYVEEAYRGAALLSQTAVGVYLSKFAVERQAQGDPARAARYEAYLRDNIVYRLGADEQAGLLEFFRRAHALGLVPAVPELRFHEQA